jgi:hypothetical protein
MYRAVETAPTLLHLSVFLFNIGLVIFFFTIYKTMAIIVLVSVALFGVAYFMVTILPCLDRICPYSTPMSIISWYLWHLFALPITLKLQGAVKILHTQLVPYNLGDVRSWRQETLKGWLEWIEKTLRNQSNRLRDGYQGRIVKDALEAPQSIDVKALTWLFQLPALSEEGKFERYVASIPEEIIVKLFIEPEKPGNISFPEHLSSLLRSCALDTIGFDENTYKGRLLVCLDAVRHIAKASVITPDISPSYESTLKDVRNNFANICLMRKLWATRDPAIRMTARSICALLARYLLHQDNLQLEQPELAWLQDVLGERSGTIYNHRGNYTVLDNMAIDSFVYGSLSHQTDYSDLPIAQATSESFIDSLVILTKSGTRIADIRSDIRVFADKFGSLIRRIEGSSHQHRDSIVDKLRRIFQDVFPSAEPQSQTPNT